MWVDDIPTNNSNEVTSFEALGINVAIAKSTDEALAKIKSEEFDLIISDMGRPPDPRAGYTLLDKLRQSGNKIPFIIYAGSRALAHQIEARAKGALGTTNRPSELFEMVVGALGLSRG